MLSETVVGDWDIHPVPLRPVASLIAGHQQDRPTLRIEGE
jgi:hypothetical protein